MTIEHINLQPNTTKVSIGDYGEFTIRKFGAGEELELSRIAREITELGEEMNDMDEYKEAEKNGDKEKTAEGMKKLQEAMDKIHKLQNEQFELLKGVVSAKDENQVKRLFNENSTVELFNTIGKVARG